MVQVPMPGNDPMCGARSRTATHLHSGSASIHRAAHHRPYQSTPNDYAVGTGEPGRIDSFERAGFNNEGTVMRSAPASHEVSRRLHRWLTAAFEPSPNSIRVVGPKGSSRCVARDDQRTRGADGTERAPFTSAELIGAMVQSLPPATAGNGPTRATSPTTQTFIAPPSPSLSNQARSEQIDRA